MLTKERIDKHALRAVDCPPATWVVLRSAMHRLVDKESAATAPLLARIAEQDALIGKLRLEAQIQAQEARTANATIAEIYQSVTGGTGEPGNWHGAAPVKARIAELETALSVKTTAVGYWKDRCAAVERELEAARKDAERLDWLERETNAHGAIHLHDGSNPSGHGLGLRPGALARTLRIAIDAALKEQT